MTLTLAHLSDVHLAPVPMMRWRDLSLKRGLGFVNWHRRRRLIHDRGVLDLIIADLKAQAPGHIAVTGDLVNIGLPAEHVLAAQWLEALGSPDQVTVIPGNHDIYVRHLIDPGTGRWSRYMASDGAAEAQSPAFPFIRRREGVALIGLNSALPTPPFVAGGMLGGPQIAALGRALDETRREGLVRVVLIHHPPRQRLAAALRGLFDAGELERVLTAHGAELVLYGHNHVCRTDRIDTVTGPCAVVGVASASASRAYHGAPPARYNLITIESNADGGLRIRLVTRGLDPATGGIGEIDRLELAGATCSREQGASTRC